MTAFLKNSGRQIVLFIKKVKSNWLIIIDERCYCQSVLKFLRKISFNSLFKYLDTNNKESGFRPCDSYVHQSLWIIHDNYKAFDASPLLASLEVTGVFLVLSKAFNRVWREVLMYKLKYLGRSGKLYTSVPCKIKGGGERVHDKRTA